MMWEKTELSTVRDIMISDQRQFLCATGTETENDVVAYGLDGSWKWADRRSAY